MPERITANEKLKWIQVSKLLLDDQDFRFPEEARGAGSEAGTSAGGSGTIEGGSGQALRTGRPLCPGCRRRAGMFKGRRPQGT